MSLLVDAEAEAEKLRVADDPQLLARSRNGDCLAFAELFIRYRRFAMRIAARTSSALDPEDVATEAFTRIWRAMRNGGGPVETFGPYLATTVRNVALNLARNPRELPLAPQELSVVLEAVGDTDMALAGIGSGMMQRAFDRLSPRWRDALWATEIDGVTTAELAARLGTSNNAAAALCLRAREGLRKAWLDELDALRIRDRATA